MDITVSLLGDTFGRVDPSLADKINQVPNSWYKSGEVNGNYDDYLIYNQNNKTIVRSVKISKPRLTNGLITSKAELISLFASNENKKQAKIKVKDLDINAI